MRVLTFTMFALATGLAAVSPAGAMTKEEEAALYQFCSGDYFRLCAEFDPNSPQVEQCFKEKSKELTPGCRSAIASFNKANPSGRKR